MDTLNGEKTMNIDTLLRKRNIGGIVILLGLSVSLGYFSAPAFVRGIEGACSRTEPQTVLPEPCADVSVCGAGKKQCECFGNDFGCIAPDSPCFDWCAGAGSSGQFAASGHSGTTAGASGKLAGAETGSERIAASKVELSDENCIYWR